MIQGVLLALCFTAVFAQYSQEQEQDSYGQQGIGSENSRYSAGGQNGYGQQDNYEQPKPEPYNFEYNVDDNYGNTHYQKEEGDDYGNKRGSYGYKDAYGVYRYVEYVADENGFRATIKTNEPGTDDADPADVDIESNEPPANTNPGSKMSSYGKSDNYGSGGQSSRLQDSGNYGGQKGSSSNANYERDIPPASAYGLNQASSGDYAPRLIARPKNLRLMSPSRAMHNGGGSSMRQKMKFAPKMRSPKVMYA